MKVEAQIPIYAGKQAVWNAITDIRNAVHVIQGIEKTELLHEPAHGLIGLKWRETRMYFGKPSAIDKWISDADEFHFYQTQAALDDFIFITTFTITELNSHVILTSTHETKPQGWLAKLKALPMIFFKGIIKKTIMQDLNDFKIYLEKR